MTWDRGDKTLWRLDLLDETIEKLIAAQIALRLMGGAWAQDFLALRDMLTSLTRERDALAARAIKGAGAETEAALDELRAGIIEQLRLER